MVSHLRFLVLTCFLLYTFSANAVIDPAEEPDFSKLSTARANAAKRLTLHESFSPRFCKELNDPFLFSELNRWQESDEKLLKENLSQRKPSKIELERVNARTQVIEGLQREIREIAQGHRGQFDPKYDPENYRLAAICNQNGQMIALAAYEIDHRKMEIYVNDAAAAPSQLQKNGGRALFQYLVKQGLLRNMKRIRLVSHNDAVGFYKTLGFEDGVGQRKVFDLRNFVKDPLKYRGLIGESDSRSENSSGCDESSVQNQTETSIKKLMNEILQNDQPRSRL